MDINNQYWKESIDSKSILNQSMIKRPQDDVKVYKEENS